METLNYTEEEATKLFDLMADLHEAKKLEEQALVESYDAQARHRELQVKAVKLECEIDRIKEKIKLQDCPYKVGQKFAVADETYDLIKIEYVSAYGGGDIDIRFKGRRKATKGWEGKSRDTTVELLNAFIIDEL
jgi:hypothetical protein